MTDIAFWSFLLLYFTTDVACRGSTYNNMIATLVNTYGMYAIAQQYKFVVYFYAFFKSSVNQKSKHKSDITLAIKQPYICMYKNM